MFQPSRIRFIVKDNLDSLSSTTGEAFVRYVNAIADSTSRACKPRSGANPLYAARALAR